VANLIGSGINQISVNGMLGNLAFQDKAYVTVDQVGIGTTFADSGTSGQVLQVSGGAYVSGNLGIGTTNPTGLFQVQGGGNSVGVTTEGRLLVGTSTSRVVGPNERIFQIESVGNIQTYLAGMSITRNNTNASSYPVIALLKTRGTTYGAVDAVQEGDGLGSIIVYGSDGITSNLSGSTILTTVDGPVSTGIVPGRIDISTRDTAGTLATRMTIKGSGNVGIGTILPGSKLTVTGDASITGPVLVGSATSTGTASQPLQVTGGAYVSGNVGIGATLPTSRFHIAGGTTVAGTAPLEITAGSLLSTIESDVFEYDGTNLYHTNADTTNGFGRAVIPEVQFRRLSATNVVGTAASSIFGTGNGSFSVLANTFYQLECNYYMTKVVAGALTFTFNVSSGSFVSLSGVVGPLTIGITGATGATVAGGAAQGLTANNSTIATSSLSSGTSYAGNLILTFIPTANSKFTVQVSAGGASGTASFLRDSYVKLVGCASTIRAGNVV
jgi:hypothetical protein